VEFKLHFPPPVEVPPVTADITLTLAEVNELKASIDACAAVRPISESSGDRYRRLKPVLKLRALLRDVTVKAAFGPKGQDDETED
jgi:hypothetical protein